MINSKDSLTFKNPNLAKQWHPIKNGNLTSDDVTAGSNKKVWWRCSNGHEWIATVCSRMSGRGCPYCSGKYACADNSLQALNPELAKQWHPRKNGNLTPNDVTTGSGRKIWWKCNKGHEWLASIDNRIKGTGCPYCSGRYACDDNSLQKINPNLAKQWNHAKNKDLTPNDVTIGSGKRVWWLCEKGHEWKASIAERTNGTGCPYCSGKRVCVDNCLQTLSPELAKQWHPSKNGDLNPSNVTKGYGKKVWWKCEKEHEWQASVNTRTNMGTGCPYCSGKRVCVDNCLQTLNPELAKQWHPSKNGILTPNNVTINTGKKVWWLCGKGHEWQERISHRTNGIGCPYCSGQHVCADNCLQTLSPELAKQWHPIKNDDLTPYDVTTGSDKKIWWQCEKGHDMESSCL